MKILPNEERGFAAETASSNSHSDMKSSPQKSFFIISLNKSGVTHYFFSVNVHVRTSETAKHFASFKAASNCIYKYGLYVYDPKIIEITEKKE